MNQLPSTETASVIRQPKPKPTPTPYLVQELFVSRNATYGPPVVALAPPQAKPTMVNPSFFSVPGVIVADNEMTANTSGDLFVTSVCPSSGNNFGCIGEFAPPYTKAPIAVIRKGFESQISCGSRHCLALDAQQNLYVANRPYIGYVVNEYASPYSSAPISVLHPKKKLSILDDFGVVADGSTVFMLLQVCKVKPSCNGWDAVANGYSSPLKWGSQTSQLTAGGTDGCQTGYSQSSCAPYDAAVDTSGDMFVSFGPSGRGNDGLVAEWTPPYKGKPNAVITNEIFQPTSIALDGKGDLFVLNNQSPEQLNITEYSPPYKGSPIVISRGFGGDDDLGMIVVDSAGNLFLSDYGSNGQSGEILEYKPPYAGTPIEITAGLSNFAPLFLTLGPSKTKSHVKSVLRP
ncbi:MAG TPA: hypothetical protein VFE16_03605 [Candidatus Cybelea sp.]|jgi:hypothetical protein|nr:hypothetical protein [Candidatus Cybelea sp.]